jgi:23S rRNA (pseudouridine1915-N3)-methyltransferase
MVEGNSAITFIIGGSIGLSNEVLERSNLKLSFSKFTFPHQLMRLILIEQIYRAFKIMNNEPYHK